MKRILVVNGTGIENDWNAARTNNYMIRKTVY
jgi:hypothetical protein